MKITGKFASLALLALMMGFTVFATPTLAQGPGHGPGGPGGPGGGQGNGQGNTTRDPLAGLKRAISQASAPALTATQETELTALITAFRDAQADDEDTALSTARDAFEAAILAGNQTAADTAAAQIAIRQSELSVARLKALAKFEITVLASLKTGGQLTLLTEKLGADKLLNLVGSLAGHGGRGR